jgi:hypothetical protein
VGPILGGSLAYIHPVRAPMAAVVGLYAIVFMLVAWGYEKFVLDPKGTTVLSGSDEKKVV